MNENTLMMRNKGKGQKNMILGPQKIMIATEFKCLKIVDHRNSRNCKVRIKKIIESNKYFHLDS